MDMEEFLKPRNAGAEVVETPEEIVADEVDGGEEEQPPELDVQKAVVEDLAADKAKLDEELAMMKGRLDALTAELEAAKVKIAEGEESARQKCADLEKSYVERLATVETLERANAGFQSEIARLKTEVMQLKSRDIDMQERNPNALALLDRDVELPDRFAGETRDHVLEVIDEARAASEKDGRLRRAQVLESVLLANEPNGTLKSRREEIEKLFRDNANLVNGPVIEFLASRNLPFKEGETYLLPAEIVKRNF